MEENQKFDLSHYINFKKISSWVLIIVIAMIMAFLISSKAYAKVEVDGASMENTLHNKQQLIVDEITYNFTKPMRGDIITFYENENKGTIVDDFNRMIYRIRYPHDEETHKRLIKRVIGVEGDRIDIKGGAVYVNGNKLKEPYTKGITETSGMVTPDTVGKNELFVLGDHRTDSTDSRIIGMIKLSQVEGKAIFRIFPFDVVGKLK